MSIKYRNSQCQTLSYVANKEEKRLFFQKFAEFLLNIPEVWGRVLDILGYSTTDFLLHYFKMARNRKKGPKISSVSLIENII